jgi:hypothetical protein
LPEERHQEKSPHRCGATIDFSIAPLAMTARDNECWRLEGGGLRYRRPLAPWTEPMAKRSATDASRSADDLPRYFVWVRGLEGPEPQKWMAMDFGIGEWKRPQVLAWMELAVDERHLSLSMLARRYPPPRVDVMT